MRTEHFSAHKLRTGAWTSAGRRPGSPARPVSADSFPVHHNPARGARQALGPMWTAGGPFPGFLLPCQPAPVTLAGRPTSLEPRTRLTRSSHEDATDPRPDPAQAGRRIVAL